MVARAPLEHLVSHHSGGVKRILQMISSREDLYLLLQGAMVMVCYQPRANLVPFSGSGLMLKPRVQFL